MGLNRIADVIIFHFANLFCSLFVVEVIALNVNYFPSYVGMCISF